MESHYFFNGGENKKNQFIHFLDYQIKKQFYVTKVEIMCYKSDKFGFRNKNTSWKKKI